MDNTKKFLIIEILLIFVSLAVLVWVALLVLDYKEVVDRDGQRIAMLKKVQESLENYYQANGHYPGTPRIDENNLVIYADWHYLITCPEMKDYFNFDQIKDPCQPEQPVDIKGVVGCPSREVAYRYIGIECKVGCEGYKLVIDLEKSGEHEFVSQSISKKTND